MSMNGVDIASYQKGIDFSKMTNTQFGIVKVTGGKNYVNPCEKAQIDSILNSNKLLGLYHYARELNCPGTPEQEAEHFLSKAKSYIGKAILALDWEATAVSLGPDWAKRWFDYVYNKTGVRALLYTGQWVSANYDWSAVANAGHELWLAQYATNSVVYGGYQNEPWRSGSVGAFRDPVMHQYAQTYVPGYGAEIDVNIFYGDATLWNKLAQSDKSSQKQPEADTMTIRQAQEKVIKIAQSQIGYKSTDKHTKYAKELDSYGFIYNGPKDGYDWCDVFADWCYIQAFGVEKAIEMIYQPKYGTGAGCTYSAQFYKNNNAWSNKPSLGAQIFFGSNGNEQHTGIVTGFDTANVYTVEGNTRGGGGQVTANTYNLSNSYISGYGIPNWKLVTNSDIDIPHSSTDEIADKSIDELAHAVLRGEYGNGNARVAALGDKYETVQKRVNELLSGNVVNKSIDDLAKEVIDGKWGNQPAREINLNKAGYDYNAIQRRVNELIQQPEFNITDIAKRVIQGEYGCEPLRSEKLRSQGYDPVAVQNEVNRLLGY